MPNCRYCGKSAGLFSFKHKECEEKHAIGLSELNVCLKNYFAGRVNTTSVGATLSNLRRTAFLFKDDILLVLCKEIDSYASALAFPIEMRDMKLVQDLISCVQLTPAEINNYGGSLRNLKQKYDQSNVISQLSKGQLPACSSACHILLGKGEQLIYTYNNVTMLQEKVEKEYAGDRSGWSMRVMKGVTYHTGGTKLKPIEHRYMNNEGTGSLYITTQHLIFQSDSAALKIPYKKIVGITPYSDGIDVHRDGRNVKRLVFQGFDGSFLMQLLPHIIS